MHHHRLSDQEKAEIYTKGQVISECNFDVLNFPKYQQQKN